MEQPIASDWFARTFDALYPVLYAHRSVESAAPEAQFAADCVALQPTDIALDLCCGNGRHLFHLRKHTAHLVGLDYSVHLLKLATETLRPLADRSPLPHMSHSPHASHRPHTSDQSDPSDLPARAKLPGAVRLLRADMRHIPFHSTFDVIFNFFTSFGYFRSPEDNVRVVRGVSSALRPSGRFFIDYVDRAFVERNLVPDSVRREGPYEIHERRWLDKTAQRVNKRTLVLEEKQHIAETEESVQLYSLEEFRRLLAEGGLFIDRVYGDYSGAPFDDEHPRMIVVGHKA